MPRFFLALLILLLLFPAPSGVAAPSRADDITGEIVEVRDDHSVRIRIEGDWLPQVGDPVMIRFRDEVPGVGVVMLDGAWSVREVEADAVWARPDGETARPQVGQLAIITSEHPRPRTVASTPGSEAKAPPEEEVTPVSADVPEPPKRRQGRRIIDRRRYFTLSAGGALVPLGESLGSNFADGQAMSVRLLTFGGLLPLRNLVVGGLISMTAGTRTFTRTFPGNVLPPVEETVTVREIVRGPGLIYYIGGSPGNVAGETSFFVSAYYLYIDIENAENAIDTVTINGSQFGAGLIYNLRRTLALYVQGTYTTGYFDEDDEELNVAFDRNPFEIGIGTSIFF